MKKKLIYYDVYLSNGVDSIILGSVSEKDLSGFEYILCSLCYSNWVSNQYVFRDDLTDVCDYLLNSFGSFLDVDKKDFIEHICETPFFIRLIKRKS